MEGMRFSSEPEVRIARALERAGIMYLPNCLVRAGQPNAMSSSFPDFLICYGGKWGILEVDGQKSHMGRATEDHERTRRLEGHGGIAYFTRFDYQACMTDPDAVVRKFIEILKLK
jgi:very-short-patch-repair endonuclease